MIEVLWTGTASDPWVRCAAAVLATQPPVLRSSSSPSSLFVWPLFLAFATLHLILYCPWTHHPTRTRQCFFIVLLQLLDTLFGFFKLVSHPPYLHALLPAVSLPVQLVLVLTAEEEAIHVILDSFDSGVFKNALIKFGASDRLDANGEMASRRIFNGLTVGLLSLWRNFVSSLLKPSTFCVSH